MFWVCVCVCACVSVCTLPCLPLTLSPGLFAVGSCSLPPCPSTLSTPSLSPPWSESVLGTWGGTGASSVWEFDQQTWVLSESSISKTRVLSESSISKQYVRVSVFYCKAWGHWALLLIGWKLLCLFYSVCVYETCLLSSPSMVLSLRNRSSCSDCVCTCFGECVCVCTCVF